MDRKKIKIIVLGCVFLVAIIFFSFLGRTKQVELTGEMPEATIPVISLQIGETRVNELFGHKGEMNLLSVRDTITPLAEDMVLPVTIETFQNHVESISYEVRSLDTQRLLEKKQVADYSHRDGLISTEFQIQNLLEAGEEYHLIITIECQGEKIHYYTRIIQARDWYVDKAVEFVKDFHEKTFNPDEAATLATYLEPNSEGDNTNLHKVTIHSSLGQISWGDFKGEVLQDPVPSIKEINDSYTAVVMNYVMVAKGEKGEAEYYNVEEYYRVRYGEINQRMYLLDYERTMNEIFRGSGDNFSDTAIRLGIREEEVSFVTNESHTMVAFVQEGDLWGYNKNTNQLSLIFSFRGFEGIDSRANNPNHNIRIIKIDENGSMDFVVYGYMNRGEHEGHTGIGVYHYDTIANTIQEELFVESRESYQVLKEGWGKLFYTGSDGLFYMVIEDELYRISLSDGTWEIMNRGLKEENSAISPDGRYIAWQEKSASNQIVVMDLTQETSQEITGAEGTILKPIGFIESDLIYGVAKPESNEFLDKLVIVDKNLQVMKEYEKPGYYITNAYVEESTIFLERVNAAGEYYQEPEADAIKSHDIEAAQTMRVGTYSTARKQMQICIELGGEIITKRPQIIMPKEVVIEEKNIVELDIKPGTGRYRVYVAGKIILDTPDMAKAVLLADERAGVIIGDLQQCIWSRGKSSSGSVADKVLADEESIQAAMFPENPVDLTGCSLSQILYFIDGGSGVSVKGMNENTLLIVGYDERNITIYDPAMGNTYKKSIEDSEELFATAGNRFITYLSQ